MTQASAHTAADLGEVELGRPSRPGDDAQRVTVQSWTSNPGDHA
jgi:hypothetical protein